MAGKLESRPVSIEFGEARLGKTEKDNTKELQGPGMDSPACDLPEIYLRLKQLISKCWGFFLLSLRAKERCI